MLVRNENIFQLKYSIFCFLFSFIIRTIFLGGAFLYQIIKQKKNTNFPSEFKKLDSW